jgi:hypothetical protein
MIGSATQPIRRLLSRGNTSPLHNVCELFPLRSAERTPPPMCGRRPIPVFVPLVSASMCRTTHPSGSRRLTADSRAHRLPLALSVPQKTVGSLPCPIVCLGQVIWLPLGQTPPTLCFPQCARKPTVLDDRSPLISMLGLSHVEDTFCLYAAPLLVKPRAIE